MYDGNAKFKLILTELGAVDSEYVCERTAKFQSEILFESRIINLHISMTKYQCSVLLTAATGPEMTLC